MRDVNGVAVLSDVTEMLLPRHTALLVVDMQNDFIHPDGWFAHNGRDVSRMQPIVPRVATLLASARAAGVLPVVVEQATLTGNRSDPPAWLYFKTRDGRERTDYALLGTWGQQTITGVGVLPDDVRVTKFRPSAFHRTSLDQLLRANGIVSVAVCGVLTQGCVQATVTDASYHDYYSVLVDDAVQSTHRELHENALVFLRSRYDAVSTSAVCRLWQSASTKRAGRDA